jgi:hypothetical protein
MDLTSSFEQPLEKIYKEKHIVAATFFGGPLVAGYLLSENFKVFNENTKSRNAIIISIIFTILLFIVLFSIPTSISIPNMLLPLIYTGIAYVLLKLYQSEDIQNHTESFGMFYSGWNTFAISLIGCFITVIAVFATAFLTDPVLNSTTKTYGKLQHEILFTPNNITVPEIDEIARTLTETGFFDQQQQKSVFAKKESEFLYVVIIPLIENAWEDPEIIRHYQYFQSQMQQYFKNGRLVIDLSTAIDIDDIKTRIE